MFYFDKENPQVLFCDNRKVERKLIDGRTFEVRPDVVVDFRALPFPDSAFNVVVFDPPHLRRAGDGSWLAQKYGVLPADGWREYLRLGFKECWRVLRPGGAFVQVERASDQDIPAEEHLPGRAGLRYPFPIRNDVPGIL